MATNLGDGTGTSTTGTEYTMINSRGKNSRKGSKASVSDNDISWMCEECGKHFKSEKDKILECEYCEQHYCIKCLKYKVGEYEAMQKPGCMWFCMKCKPKVEKNILKEKTIEEKCATYCQMVNQRIDEVEKKLETKCDVNEVKEIVKEALGTKERAPTINKQPANTMQDRSVLDETVKEMQDRKDRETNFIVFNAPEPATNVKETRVQEDIELIRGLCNDVCSLDINPHNDIVEVIRLGKKPTGENTGNPRPLKVVMKDKMIKTMMFKKLWKLRDAEDRFRSLSIQSDQTKKEREEEKKLVDEAKDRQAKDEGKCRYRVKGPPWARKIVKIRPTHDEDVA